MILFLWKMGENLTFGRYFHNPHEKIAYHICTDLLLHGFKARIGLLIVLHDRVLLRSRLAPDC